MHLINIDSLMFITLHFFDVYYFTFFMFILYLSLMFITLPFFDVHTIPFFDVYTIPFFYRYNLLQISTHGSIIHWFHLFSLSSQWMEQIYQLITDSTCKIKLISVWVHWDYDRSGLLKVRVIVITKWKITKVPRCRYSR